MNRTLSILAAALALAASAARADVNIGISLPLTGPASGLGIPMKNYFALWPEKIAGEKVNLIIVDDATDPTKGVVNAKRFVTEDKVDIIGGSAATPVAAAMADVAAESQTVQIAFSPVALPPGKDAWTFRLPQSTAVMAHAMVEHMKKNGVKTVGFLGYTDAYGESWLKDFTAVAEKAGIKVTATERFARSDTGVTGQALKLVSANPDAVLIVASGSGAAMPEMAVVERGYKGKIYQTHAAATRDLMRVGGKAVEGTYYSTYFSADNNAPEVQAFVQRYKKRWNNEAPEGVSALGYDAMYLIAAAIERAGTTQSAKLREAIASTKDFPGVTGSTTIDSKRNSQKPAVMLTVRKGKTEFFEAVAP